VPGTDHWWDDLTRDRTAAILELVLNAIADDYETLEIVLRTINQFYRDEPDLKDWKALEALPVSRPEVISALRELTQEGFAQACTYDAETKYYQAVNFHTDHASVLWFYVTDKGMRAVNGLHMRGPEIS
jgi:hypothetical protein